MSKSVFYKRSSILFFSVVFTLLIYWVIPYHSKYVEWIYSRGIYVVYRNIWDYGFGWSPIPTIYLLILLLFYFCVSKTIYFFKRNKKRKWRIWFVANGLFQIVLSGILLFYWLWGFNYKRLDPTMDFILPKSEITEDYLFNEIEQVTKEMIDLRPLLPNNLVEMKSVVEDSRCRQSLVNVLSSLQLPHSGRVRVRKLYPKGSLLHFSTAGVYVPFVGEGHIDAGLHPLTWPFTMIHEMSHGYGYTGEDVCNFWALLACVNSREPFFRYSGYFSYWRYLIVNARSVNNERFRNYWENIPEIFKTDLSSVLYFSNRYEDIMPALRDLIYDSYLKSHGIKEGLANYNRMVVLAFSWHKKYCSLEI